MAIALKQRIDGFLRQEIHENAHYPQTVRELLELAAAAKKEYERIANTKQPPAKSR